MTAPEHGLVPEAEKGLNELVDALVAARLKCQPVFVVAGAGLSAPMIPTMDGICARALEVFRKYPTDLLLKDLQTESAILDLFKADPDPILRKSPVWRDEVVPPLLELEASAKPGPQHEALAALLEANLIRGVVTPNWDRLLEQAGGNGRQRRLVLRDATSLREWCLRPEAPPAIIKLHGDIYQFNCSNNHFFDGSSSIQAGRSCPRCGLDLHRSMILPDSARRHSREMIELLGGPENGGEPESENWSAPVRSAGVVVVVGLSGSYDEHLFSLIESASQKGAAIANLRRHPRKLFGDSTIQIPAEASVAIPMLRERWEAKLGVLQKDVELPESTVHFVDREERSDALFGRIRITREEAEILAHPSFARLRHISQLGRKQRFYPSANHSRYEHAVASMHIADRLYLGVVDWLREERRTNPTLLAGYHPTRQERELVRLAALFHDFGHVWFSHLGEDILKKVVAESPTGNVVSELILKDSGQHEGLTRLFLEGDETEDSKGRRLRDIVESKLNEVSGQLGIGFEDFYSLIAGRSRLRGINHLIASSLDSDKLEYLIRDGTRTGKGAGLAINVDAVAAGLKITEFGQLAIRFDAMHVVDRVVAERYLMFEAVYHDDRVRVLEASLREVVADYLHERMSSWSQADALETLRKREPVFAAEVNAYASDAASIGTTPRRYQHWQAVLALVAGENDFPPLEQWLLRAGSRFQKLPADEARKGVTESISGLRRDLESLFRRRYHHKAVFAMDQFEAHIGSSELPIAGDLRLYAPSEMSPLVAGLQDYRLVPIRLAVLYYEDQVAGGCGEEIAAILHKRSQEFEIITHHPPSFSKEGSS